jgi:hypothetical protein
MRVPPLTIRCRPTSLTGRQPGPGLVPQGRGLSSNVSTQKYMSYQNYIGITEHGLSTPLYRIFPMRRLRQLLTDKQNVLVKPSKWDDPYENMLLAAGVITEDGELGDMSSMRDAVYGQCWTMHRDTDAMWRIYSHDKDGVRVRSSPRRLLGPLLKANPKFGNVQCFIGKVKYRPEGSIPTYLSMIDLFASNGSGIAKSLLIKRKEFKHEKEIRLIYSAPAGDLYSYPIEPSKMITEITFDPRMSPADVVMFQDEIRSLGYTGKINQSELYQAPKRLVFRV